MKYIILGLILSFNAFASMNCTTDAYGHTYCYDDRGNSTTCSTDSYGNTYCS